MAPSQHVAEISYLPICSLLLLIFGCCPGIFRSTSAFFFRRQAIIVKGVKIPALENTLISLMIDYSSLWQIQTEAARIATGTTKLVSIENLYSDIGWDTLEARRKKTKTYSLLLNGSQLDSKQLNFSHTFDR